MPNKVSKDDDDDETMTEIFDVIVVVIVRRDRSLAISRRHSHRHSDA